MDGGYSENYFEFEIKHWWFVARRKILRRLVICELRKLGKKKFGRVLEIGCFTGKNIEYLRDLGSDWVGIEPDPEAAELARRLVPDGTIIIGKFPNIKATGTFDAIFLFDVLEHLADPIGALAEIKQQLNSGGLLLVTVPAYPWLWTKFDEINRHYRRYTATLLRQQLQSAGFNNFRVGYFNSLLFAPAAGVRLFSKYFQNGAPAEKVAVPMEPVNRILNWVFSFELHLLPLFFFPFGLSVISISHLESVVQDLLDNSASSDKLA